MVEPVPDADPDPDPADSARSLPSSDSNASAPLTKVGLAFRSAFASWLDCAPREIECIEVTAEEFYKGGRGRLRLLGSTYPMLVHTQRLSLGAPGPLDASELHWFASLVSEAKPLWISDHLGFRCTRDVDLGSPNPIALNRGALNLVADRARRIMEACRTPLLLENISACIAVKGSMSEPEFLSRLCETAGCGVLLDVTGLLVNSRNHAFDPVRWLDDLDRARVTQVHIGGCMERDGYWDDTHDGPIHADAWALLDEVLKRCSVEAIVLERDASFPAASELRHELRRIKDLCNARG